MADTTSQAAFKKTLIVTSVASILSGLFVGVMAALSLTGQLFSSSNDPVVAKYDGKPVRASEAFKPIKTVLFSMEEDLYRKKEAAINEYIGLKLIEVESKKQNLTPDQLVDKEMGTGEVEVTEKQIEEFLAARGLGVTNPQMRQNVKDWLKFHGKSEKRQGYLAKLRQASKVEYVLEEPESPRISVSTEGYPTWGSSKALVTIVEFSDFECPYCSRAVPVLDRIKKEYGPDKVRIIFRDMPLPNHNRATPASLAAHCANEQGKFWEYHDVLFKNQTKLEDNHLKDYASTVGVDDKRFSECFSKKKYQGIIDQSRREAEAAGIEATPSFVINGKLLQGAQQFEAFKAKIDRALRG